MGYVRTMFHTGVHWYIKARDRSGTWYKSNLISAKEEAFSPHLKTSTKENKNSILKKKKTLTYNWITWSQLLDANHDFLGEGPWPKHLGDQALAARLLRGQLAPTEQHFVGLKCKKSRHDVNHEGKWVEKMSGKFNPQKSELRVDFWRR